MKTYFNNFPYTVDTLKAEYRALCLTMHPDKGGNADEFKRMNAEYNSILKNIDGTAAREAEEARRRAEEDRREREENERQAREWEAKEKARREQEKREEAERIRKAQEVSRAAVRAWASILERIPEPVTGKKRAYDFADDKSRAAYVAATKRNIKAVINHYFKGLKVTVSISGRIWREDFTISWQDGPSIKELRDTCKELEFFVPCYYESDPYADYGDYRTREGSAPWREAYGGALGDVTNIDYTRGLSDEGKQQAEAMAAQYFANFDPKSDAETFAANLQEFGNLAKAAGFERENLTNIFQTITGQYYANLCGYWSEITGEINRRDLRKVLAEHVRVNVTPKEKAPEFVPTYGPTYKAIKKALGANVFYIDAKDSRKNAANELNIFAAAERLARGEAVQIGHKSNWDGDPVIYGTDRGGRKTQQKRAAKFEAVGVILEGVSFNTYGHINAQGIKAETLEALRREAEDIERQRREWENKQNRTQKADKRETTSKATNSKQDNSKADSSRDDVDMTAAPAEGLRLVEIAGGVAVIADDWKTTYFNKKYIKAHGAHWNKEHKQWEATDPQDIDALRAWFFFHGKPTDQGATIEDVTTEEEPEPESNTANDTTEQADTLHEAEDITDNTTDTTDDGEAAPLEGSREINAFCEAVADVLRIFADIVQEAKKWEGVTIPAGTLERWKQEATDGTKTAAARLCEVCACLASLTPDSRRDFDALGVIFWTLSEQLRNGSNPDTLQAATDYARAQLFELIDRTQNENQARAVREANGESDGQRKAA